MDCYKPSPFFWSQLLYNNICNIKYYREDLLDDAKLSSSKLQEHKNLIILGEYDLEMLYPKLLILTDLWALNGI